MTDKPKNDSDLAKALGVNRSQIARQKQAGMPTHSISAAKAWRDANLDFTRTKVNPARAAAIEYAHPPRRGAPAKSTAPDLAGRATALLSEAREILLRDDAFDDETTAALCAALSAVPEDQRRSVRLCLEVMDELIVHHLVESLQGRPEFKGWSWYAACAGELPIHVDTPA